MPITSAGLLLYRFAPSLEVLLGHMGGPFWAKKDAAGWSIPKGILEPGEDALTAAIREFGEELGLPAPSIDYTRLGEFRQSSGKVVIVFAGEADLAVDVITSNTFELEWPPRSGRIQEFPELDRAGWFDPAGAGVAVVAGQVAVIDALEESLDRRS